MAIKPTIKPEQSGPVQEFIGTAYDVVKKVHDNLDAILNLDLQSVNEVNNNFITLQTNITQVFNDTEVLLTQLDTTASEVQVSANQIEAAVANFGKYYLGTKTSAPTLNNEGNFLVEGNFYFNSTTNTLDFYTGSSWISPQTLAINAADSASTSANTATTQAAQTSLHKADAEAAQIAAELAETNTETYKNEAQTAASDAQASATYIETFIQSAINASSSANTDADRAEQARIGAEAAELAAANSAVSASTHEANAATSAGLAEAAELGAETAQDKAEQWAEELTDTEVEPGKYSAKHHATKASESAAAANTSATQAQASQIAAETAEDNAKTSETNAKTSETNASASAIDADNSELSAQTYASDAQASATSASTSASTAEGHKLDAASSAQAASTSEANAASSESAAAISETNAAGHASDALASKTAAATSESNALSHKNAAAVSAANALISEQNASTSESNSASILASVESLIDQFGDQYLGAKPSDPSTDNDGNALAVGAVYLNTTDNVLKFYSGSSWINPESNAVQAASDAEASALDAANSATTAENHATSAQNSATSASTSKADAELAATNAETSETNALASENAAASSASNAQTSATDASNSASAAEASKNAAETAETNATTKATEAATSAQAAQTAQTGAETAENKAEKWAEELTNIEVEAGKYSAKHHAEKSADSASAASVSEANALSHKNDAEAAASNAATSETNAASSASSAATSATNADASEAAALNYRNQAQTSATEAATSASDAALSETNAATSATNAANSATAADADRVAAESAKNTAQSAATTATTKANEASTSATNAATSETNAANSATAADSSATDAFASETKAEQWATELENVEVEPGKYSAFHHAQKAEDSAFAANASEIAAETAETNAQNSATAAATSESNAAASETSASQSASTAVAAKDAAQLAESGAQASEGNAATSASQAATSASNASTSENHAAVSESNAATSESNALASENKSQAWAETAEDIEVETGKYSALHHAAKAADSASSASTSASTATTQAGLATTAKDDAVTAKNAAEAAESTATTKASEASTSATNAATSETNAATSESNAATSATNAANSETAASGYEADALTHKNAAQASETKASQWAEQAEDVEVETGKFSALHHAAKADDSATQAATSATNASNSESAAITAKTAAETARTGAETAETNAQSHATSANNSATAASTSETNAATSETNAANSATQAANSASAAQTAETNAGNYATAAQAARDQALAAFDSFDDKYLGEKTSDPTTDNDGQPLISGTLYFNTTTDTMRVYDGTNWKGAYASLDGAMLSANNLSDLSDINIALSNLGLDLVDNVSAANLRDRSTHTGSQAISTITGLQTALAGKAATSHNHAITDVTNLQSTLDGKSDDGHGHVIADVTGLQTALNGKVGTTGYNKSNWDLAHSWGDHALEGYLKSVSWTQVTGKPTTFTPSAHTHSVSEVTGLQAELDGKAPTLHNHTIANVTGLQTALDDKSQLGHIHAISEVTGLQSALDGKAASSHTHDASDISSGIINNLRLPETFRNLTDGVSNLPYRYDIIVYGDSDKYYPVHFAGGNQNLLRTIKIWRSYSEQGPADWNTPTHKGSLNLEWRGNYGSWGGASYQEWIYEHSEQYSTLLGGTQRVDNSYGMAFFLRGGGTVGAVYHIASDQPLSWTNGYLTYSEPTAFYNQDQTFDHTNDAYDKYAPAPLLTPDTQKIESIKVRKGFMNTSAITSGVFDWDRLPINSSQASNWDAAFAWGDHSLANYITHTEGDAKYLQSFTELDPTVPSHVKSITTTEKDNWNTAFSWGDHSLAGYASATHTHDNFAGPITIDNFVEISAPTGIGAGNDVSIKTIQGSWWSDLRIIDNPQGFVLRTSQDAGANWSELFRADSDGNLIYNANNIYHEGNKPTPADIGAATSTHSHAFSELTAVPATATRWPSWTEVTSKPSTFTPSAHTHTSGDITDFTEATQDVIGGMVSTNTESGIVVSYNDTNGKLNFDVNDPVITLTGDVSGSATMTNLGNVSINVTVADDSHAHTIANVDGLQTALNGKAASSHGHNISNVSGLQTALDGKSDTGHGHNISDVTGLQTSLDGKAATSHNHAWSDITSGVPTTATRWPTWSEVTSKPATFTPTAHTHAISEVTGLQNALDSKIASSEKGVANGVATLDGTGKIPNSQLPAFVDDVIEYADLASLPATGESGKLYVTLDTGKVYRWSGSNYIVISDSASSADEAAKLSTARTISLSGDVSGSTTFDGSQNVSISVTIDDDSHNHTIANIDGLQTALNGKAASSHNHTISNITGLQTALDGKSPTGHTHAWADITTGVPATATRWPTWSEVTSKPATFTPASHSHAIADVTNLQTTLDGKAASTHTHGISDVTGLQTALNGKVSTSGYNNTNWDTAYNWGDHASAGYAADSSVVKLSGTQTVTGLKTFSGGIAGNGSGLTNIPSSNITYDNTTSGLTASNVKAAIDELAASSGGADEVSQVTGTTISTSLGTVLYKYITANTTLTVSLNEGESIVFMLSRDRSYRTVTWNGIDTWVSTKTADIGAPELQSSDLSNTNHSYDVMVFWRMNGRNYGSYLGISD